MPACPTGFRFDPALDMHEMADNAKNFEPFETEPYDLVADMPQFCWPTAVISGGRDLTTPPAVAERIASLIPGATLVRMPTAGHSVLDSRERAALTVIDAVRTGTVNRLTAQQLDALPERPALRLLVAAISAAARLESVLPLRRVAT